MSKTVTSKPSGATWIASLVPESMNQRLSNPTLQEYMAREGLGEKK